MCTGSTAAPDRRQAAIGATASTVLLRAGLADDRAVNPTSITAHAGARAFAETGRIEEAALVMGCKSLTTAAQLIGYDWRHRE